MISEANLARGRTYVRPNFGQTSPFELLSFFKLSGSKKKNNLSLKFFPVEFKPFNPPCERSSPAWRQRSCGTSGHLGGKWLFSLRPGPGRNSSATFFAKSGRYGFALGMAPPLRLVLFSKLSWSRKKNNLRWIIV